jgi:hypothetical protein
MRQVVEVGALHRGWGEWVDVGKGRKMIDPAQAQRSCGGDGVVRRRGSSPRQGQHSGAPCAGGLRPP